MLQEYRKPYRSRWNRHSIVDFLVILLCGGHSVGILKLLIVFGFATELFLARDHCIMLTTITNVKTSHVNVNVHVSHLSHSLYITVGYRRWLWTSLTSPLVILAMISSADSCRIARLCAQQLSSRINVLRLLNFLATILRLFAVLTFCFSIIYKFRRLLLFRQWNCVPAAALDDRRLIWLVTVVRRWPRRRRHSSVVEFPPRWCRWVKWDRLKASLNVWRLRRWFWRPHRQRRWIRLFDCRCVAARVLGTIALGPNAYKRSNEKWN